MRTRSVRGVPILLVSAFIAGSVLSAQPISLAYQPIDVQYSKSLDRLIMISANPNKVHLVNPVSGTETSVNLSLAPLSISVSPDGTHAAVGHDGWISYVNLSAGYVEKNLAVSLTANVLILAGNGNIWVSPSSTINIATGVQTASSGSLYGVSHPALHPNGNWVYNTDDSTSPNIMAKGDMSSGTYQFLYIYPYWGDFPSCGKIFYSADGNRLLTGCGTLFRTTASKTDDMKYSGALAAASIVTAAADSTVSHEFAVIPGVNSFYYGPTTTDTEIQFYDDSYLTLLGRVSLPTYTSGSASAPWHGRYVYYSPDSSKLYVVLQADPKANLTNDYAVYPLTLSTGNGCGPSLAANSTNVVPGGGSVNVTVTATTGCLWQASSNATWLFLSAGGVGSGNGMVTIQASPNLQTASRSGTVTIAGLTYTVTQDPAAVANVNPVSPSPVRPVAADYSAAIDRMILVSTNPNLLTILDPVSGSSNVVLLMMPPTALSISPDGLHAAVGHDGRISYVNLSTATVEKTFPVTETVFNLALGNTDIYAFPLHDQWQAVRIVNIASGVETLWNEIYAGEAAGRITPNGKYLYINATKRYDISAGQPPSAFDASLGYNTSQWFSQDGQRLFTGSGSVYRLSDVAAQDLQYSGTTGAVQGVANSTTQQVTAVIPVSSSPDTSITFIGQQFLASLGSISIPKFTSGANSYDAHGRYLFWNTAANKLFAVVQADPASGLLNDYAIYTISWAGGCNTSFGSSTASVAAAGGTFTASITATAGCAWRTATNASWLNVTANAFSAGPATISYVADPNPTTTARTATITVDGKTMTVTQAAGSQVTPAAVVSLPFRVADAEYSAALDKIVMISSSPNRLNIYDPATFTNTTVALPLPGNAVSVSSNGLTAAVGHDGAITIVNLQTAAIVKTLNTSITCYDVVLADNGYVYASSTGGGTAVSINIASGVETAQGLTYDGANLRLNATGDAIYTAGTGTSSDAVTRFSIATGLLTYAYQSQIYGPHPMGNYLWFTLDGRFVTDNGTVYRTGSSLATDFVYTGTMSSLPGRIGSISHSIPRGLFASVATNSYNSSTNSDETLYLHGDKYLAVSSEMTLPAITVGGVSAASHGRFVFWNSTASSLYVLMQADSSAGFLNDYALYTFSPSFTSGCAVTLGISSGTAIAFPDTGNVAVSAASNCIWEAKSNASWINIDTGTLGVGTGNVGFSVPANSTTSTRTGTITVGGQTFTLTQAAGTGPNYAGSIESSTCNGITGWAADKNSLNTALTVSLWYGGTQIATVIANGSRPDIATLLGDNGLHGFTLQIPSAYVNGLANSYTIHYGSSSTAVLGSQVTLTCKPSGSGINVGLVFYPITPCRVADTRGPAGFTGQFGPPYIAGGQTRTYNVLSSSCAAGIPSNVAAYALNFTVVPPAFGPWANLTTWPAGAAAMPNVSTLNYSTSVVANAAIVPAGTNGGINVYANYPTDVLFDITGYFAPPTPSGLEFYTVTPCRIADTRPAAGYAGQFGAPTMSGGQTRTFNILANGCAIGIPTTVAAYSLNFTVVPNASDPPANLTTWPAGASSMPNVSTLNYSKAVVANAAIVPAGTNEAINVFANYPTDVLFDINGYFAPPASAGLHFYPVTPCRIADTRPPAGFSGQFGPPTMTGGQSRTFNIPASSCGIPSNAAAYSMNFTVVPPAGGPAANLTTWPTGGSMPNVSTLNYYGNVVANAAIVPAGTNGAINIFVNYATDVILDINGYFAP